MLELLANCTFPPPGTEVTCAVSGGADSMALMILAVAAGCNVTAVHVDHRLRSGSDREGDVVAGAARRFGAAFRSETIDVGDGPNLEARARDARYAVLPADVMTGHTADDQAETMLLNLMRGASSSGLAAMRPGLRRPILALRRASTEDLCRTLELTVVDDPSNRDPAFLRNRVRHELLPAMNALAQRDLVPVLTRQAGLLRDDADLLDELAAGHRPDRCQAAGRSTPAAGPARRAALAGHRPPARCGHRRSGAACRRRPGQRLRHRRRAASSDPGNDYACSAIQRRPRADSLAIRMFARDGGNC